MTACAVYCICFICRIHNRLIGVRKYDKIRNKVTSHTGCKWTVIGFCNIRQEATGSITNPYQTNCILKLVLNCFESIFTIWTLFWRHDRAFLCYFVKKKIKLCTVFEMYFRYSLNVFHDSGRIFHLFLMYFLVKTGFK